MTDTIIREPQQRYAEQLATLLNTDDGLRDDLEISADSRITGADVLRDLREWCRPRRSTTFAIVAGDTVVGMISLSHRSEDGRTAQIGYWVGTSHRRQGHCTRAFAAVLRQAASEGIRSVSSTIVVGNIGSRRIWERHGAVSTRESADRRRYEIKIGAGLE